jgi:hypothetical protein
VTPGPVPAGADLALGNDVVDLEDAEARLEGLHPRFEERVFSAAERAALARSPHRQRLHWALWAAKESAYKARKRLDATAVFSPREFEVELSPLPVAGGTSAGRVVHHGEVYEVELRLAGAWVHAVTTTGRAAGRRPVSAVEAATDEPGYSVRRLAEAAIAAMLGLEAGALRIAGRPPVATHRGRPVDVGLSLSHHGRFVAFAFVPPRRGHLEQEGDRPDGQEHVRPPNGPSETAACGEAVIA